MSNAQVKQGDRRNLSNMEKNKVIMKFMKMNEQPEQFVLTNQYMERDADYIQKTLLSGLQAAMETTDDNSVINEDLMDNDLTHKHPTETEQFHNI